MFCSYSNEEEPSFENVFSIYGLALKRKTNGAGKYAYFCYAILRSNSE
jgi:hypothetical protein